MKRSTKKTPRSLCRAFSDRLQHIAMEHYRHTGKPVKVRAIIAGQTFHKMADEQEVGPGEILLLGMEGYYECKIQVKNFGKVEGYAFRIAPPRNKKPKITGEYW